MGAHALLSASGAHRWLHCTPSARLEARLPDTSSPAALQGTIAHELAENKLLEALGRPKTSVKPVHELIDADMEEHAGDYAEYVMSRLVEARKACGDPFLLVEERLDFSHIVPEGFGTGDAVLIAEPTLEIIDFKYGTGVLVEAKNNPQMLLYALGALHAFGSLYDISSIRMTIFQPRRNHVDSWEISVEELQAWGEAVAKPAADLAFNGEGDFNAGSWCQFCKLSTTCKTRADKALEIINKYFDVQAEELSDEATAEILADAAGFKKWLSAIESYALQAALDGTKQWPGFKLVAGRAVRKYVDEEKIAETLLEAGYAREAIFEQKLLTITAMEKLVGKKRFAELCQDLIHVPPGKPALVPESDKRPAINPTNFVDCFEEITE